MIDLLPKPHIIGSDVSSALGIPENSTADTALMKLAPALTACHCENGTYEGNGSNTLTLTFQRKPLFVALYGYKTSGIGAGAYGIRHELVYIYPAARNATKFGDTNGSSLVWGDTSLTVEGDRISGSSDSNKLHNMSGMTYFYFAITE